MALWRTLLSQVDSSEIELIMLFGVTLGKGLLRPRLCSTVAITPVIMPQETFPPASQKFYAEVGR